MGKSDQVSGVLRMMDGVIGQVRSFGLDIDGNVPKFGVGVP